MCSNGSISSLLLSLPRSRTSPTGSTSTSLLMASAGSQGSALSLTSCPTLPSSLSSNPLSLSPTTSPAPSPAFSPAPSPMRLLSEREGLEETAELREFEQSLSLEWALDAGNEFALTHLTLDMLQVSLIHFTLNPSKVGSVDLWPHLRAREGEWNPPFVSLPRSSAKSPNLAHT